MLFATLGKLDFITVIILLGAAILPHTLMLYAGIYLLLKGIIFILMSRDFASHVDFGCGAYLVLLSFGLYIPYLHQGVLFWLIQKTALTFIAIGFHLMVFYNEHREDMPAFLR